MKRILILLVTVPVVSLAQPAFGDSSFEAISVTPGNFVQAPPSPSWNFTNVSDSASGVANGNGSWGTGGLSGQKYAYVQRNAQINQTVSGFVIGQQYEVRFGMTRRNGSVGGNDPNDIGVQINGSTVATLATINDARWRVMRTPVFTATSSSMNFRWQGLSGGDRTSLFDDFQVMAATQRSGILRDGDFEVVNYFGGGWSYNPGSLLGSDWQYSGQSGNGSGTASAGSPWGNTAASGQHFAFIQGSSTLSQTMTNLAVGSTYFVKFAHNRRSDNPGHRIRVRVNETEILAPILAPTSWTDRTTTSFVATSSTMSLQFEGVVAGSSDFSSLIDNVQVVPEPLTIVGLGMGALGAISRRRRHKLN